MRLPWQCGRVTDFPTQVRHYYRGARRPFLNLSDLPDEQLSPVIDALMNERRSGQHRRAFGRRYMELRRRTETKMRHLFVEAGGRRRTELAALLRPRSSEVFPAIASAEARSRPICPVKSRRRVTRLEPVRM